MTRAHSGRSFVLGFDGVPWRLVDDWVSDGELPNFGRLVREGAAGPLRSTTPANTPVAWSSIATGTWPDAHGIYEFIDLDESYGQQPYSREDIARPALWDMLTPAIVGNVPMTYPAPSVDGQVVTGMMSPTLDDDAVEPASLRSAIDREIPEYGIDIKWRDYVGREQEFLRDLDELITSRRDLLELLMETEEWRLFFFVFVAPDRLQHLVWDDDILLDHYRRLDAILGDVLDYCEARESNLFVVSDHGFEPVSKVVSVNRILLDAGFLSTKTDTGTRSVFSAAGITRSRLESALSSVGLSPQRLVQLLPWQLVETLARQVPGNHGLYDVDLSVTTAFHHGLGSVYINRDDRFQRGVVADGESDAVKSRVMAVLENATDPETGASLLRVYDGAELFSRDSTSPDIVVEARDGYHVKPKLLDSAVVPADDIAGYHEPEGLFMAWGPSIAAETTPEEATVVDVAPTVLHAAGRPIPARADGRILAEVLTTERQPDADTRAEKNYTRRTEARSTNGSDVVEDRLRGLGYLE